MTNEVMTLEELAVYLKLTPRTLHQKAMKGEIPGKKVFGKWRFHKSAIDTWLFDFDTDKFDYIKDSFFSKSVDKSNLTPKKILTQKVSTLPLTDEQRKVYLFLYEQTYFAGQDESNFIELNSMSDVLSMTLKDIKKAITKLVKLNLVKEVAHEGTDGSTAFKYHVFLPHVGV